MLFKDKITKQQALLEACRIAGGQNILARKLEVSRTRLGNWVNSKTPIPYHIGMKISRLTGVSIERLCPEEKKTTKFFDEVFQQVNVKVIREVPLKNITITPPQMINTPMSITTKPLYISRPIIIDTDCCLIAGLSQLKLHQTNNHKTVSAIIIDIRALLLGVHKTIDYSNLLISEVIMVGCHIKHFLRDRQGYRSDLNRKENKKIKNRSKLVKKEAPLVQHVAQVKQINHDKEEDFSTKEVLFVQKSQLLALSPGEKTRTFVARCIGLNHETYRLHKKIVFMGSPELVAAFDKKQISTGKAIKIIEQSSSEQEQLQALNQLLNHKEGK
ncbi:MAG: YdaS family helix-turn-helix protein [Gammaproteobacteria bacterium]